MPQVRQKKGDQALGRSRGGLSTKIHLSKGSGLWPALPSPAVKPAIARRRCLCSKACPGSLSADKAYDTDAIIDYLATNDIEAVIPPRSHRLVQRPFDRHQHKNRNLIERFFCRIKQFRRIATRYDKLAERFASFIALCAAVIWLA